MDAFIKPSHCDLSVMATELQFPVHTLSWYPLLLSLYFLFFFELMEWCFSFRLLSLRYKIQVNLMFSAPPQSHCALAHLFVWKWKCLNTCYTHTTYFCVQFSLERTATRRGALVLWQQACLGAECVWSTFQPTLSSLSLFISLLYDQIWWHYIKHQNSQEQLM